VYRIGVDVGGTFTDLVAVDDCGNATWPRSPLLPKIRRSASSMGSGCWGKRSGSRSRRYWQRRSGSFTGRRSRPMHCLNTRGRGSGC
jgi:hypothetical protein